MKNLKKPVKLVLLFLSLIALSSYQNLSKQDIKNIALGINSPEKLIINDWYLDSTYYIDSSKVVVQRKYKKYRFSEDKIFIIEKESSGVSNYKINGNLIELYSNDGIMLDRAEILKINPRKLVLQTNFKETGNMRLYLTHTLKYVKLD